MKITIHIFSVCLLLRGTISQEGSFCNSQWDIRNAIEWPKTPSGGSTISQPPCMNNNKEYVYRNCSEKRIWVEELPSCSSIQRPIVNCPENFYENIDTNICYTWVHGTYPPKCPYEDPLPYYFYKDLIANFNLTIWLPVARDGRLGFLQWAEPSSNYKTDYDGIYYVEDKLIGKDCLVKEGNFVRATSCSESHFKLCAYRKLDQNDKNIYDLCNDTNPICKQSDFGPKSKCFCVGGSGQNQSEFTKAEFLRRHQNNIYKLLTCDPCTMGLEKTADGTYVWVNSGVPLNYTAWSKEEQFEEGHIYGAATPDGWILTKEPYPCFLYETELQTVVGEIELVHDVNSNFFILTVRNPRGLKHSDSSRPSKYSNFIYWPLVYCFTDATALNLLYRYSDYHWTDITVEGDSMLYTFAPFSKGPGYYWCEAFTYPDLTLIKTKQILNLDLFGPEYVAILKVNYVPGTNPLSNDTLEFWDRILDLTVRTVDRLKDYTPRIMRIEDVNEETHEVTVNVHFTCHDKQKSDDLAELKEIITESLTSLDSFKIEIIDFLSADYCADVSGSGLTWPKTSINESVYPSQHCFTSSARRMERLCAGDFISGARWQPEGNCTIVETSNFTDFLSNLMDSTDSVDLRDILNITSDELKPIDVYLIVNILTKDSITDTNKYLFGKMLIKLLKIDAGTLRDSQLVMRATDLLLGLLGKVNVDMNISTSEFVFLSSPVDAVSFQKQDDGIVAIPIDSDVTLYTINRSENTLSIVWLNATPPTESANVNFFFFLNDLFFQEEEPRNLTNIVGVTIPSNDTFDGSLFISQYLNSRVSANSCFSWGFNNDESTGSWVYTGPSSIQSSFVRCEYSQLGFFALDRQPLTNPNTNNITGDLTEILESDDTSYDIIQKLLNISERYGEFDYEDVYLVEKILERVSNDDDIDLAALAVIVSNLHGITRSVLTASQQLRHATDGILYTVDEILKKHKFQSTVNVTADNFFILIADLDETDIAGLVLLDRNSSFELEIVFGNVTMDNISAYGNVDSAVILSPQLKNQLKNDSKIIITVFSNDSLFNEAEVTSTYYTTKVFGVILPEIDAYSGPIWMVHNVAGGYHEQCVHWFYDKPDNVSGTWRKDHDGQTLSSLISCEFWHSTHFALLILDKDAYHSDVLDWITTINCGLSLLGCASIILTAVFFKTWRVNTGNQVLVHFVVAVILQIGVFYVSDSVNRNSEDNNLCIIIGAALHYTVVSQFCWMFIIAILQFKRFVEVLGGPPKKILLKACLCGWALPLLPVACVLALDKDNYVSGKIGLCYPSGLGLYLGVWLPVAITVAINLVIFIYIMFSVVHKKTECREVGNNEAMFQWRLAVLLFFMLGLTWIFGFLSELNFGIVFVYLFCFTATLQGFVMFLFFIIFNGNTRYLYTQAFRRCCHRKHC